jgi:hypothetical protein
MNRHVSDWNDEILWSASAISETDLVMPLKTSSLLDDDLRSRHSALAVSGSIEDRGVIHVTNMAGLVRDHQHFNEAYAM